MKIEQPAPNSAVTLVSVTGGVTVAATSKPHKKVSLKESVVYEEAGEVLCELSGLEIGIK